MGIFSARIHGILDVITVLVLALGPFIAGLGGSVALIAWTFAALHLILVLITRYPLGRFPIVPFWVHGVVEMVVGVFLLLVPVIGGYGPGSPGRRFYTIVGAFVLVVWALTAYRERERAAIV
jgi:peptidoglycan/LPS O-acetylase OafA/YrhL